MMSYTWPARLGHGNTRDPGIRALEQGGEGEVCGTGFSTLLSPYGR